LIDPRRKLHELLGKFDSAMLVTSAGEGRVHGRPMHVAQVEQDDGLWFITDKGSGKVDELTADMRCAITMQSGNRHVSMTGLAELVDDHDKIRELWRETMRVWFPKGAADPSIVLIHFVPEEAEYWDFGGLRNHVRFLVGAAKAIVTGVKPDDHDQSPERHATLAL